MEQQAAYYLVDIRDACDTHAGCVVSVHHSEALAKAARARMVNRSNTDPAHPAWQCLRIVKTRRIAKIGPGQLLPVVNDPSAPMQWC